MTRNGRTNSRRRQTIAGRDSRYLFRTARSEQNIIMKNKRKLDGERARASDDDRDRDDGESEESEAAAAVQ